MAQQTLKLHFEIEETQQSLEQYNNFENAYKENINRLNEVIFNHEKNSKNYESNLKNLKNSLKEIFKQHNFIEVDNKILLKVNEINLVKSHEELVYITKRYNIYLKKFYKSIHQIQGRTQFLHKRKKGFRNRHRKYEGGKRYLQGKR